MGLDSCSSSRFEVSPYNPRARRIPGGIWNEDTLPVTEWESADHRVVLVESIQEIFGLDDPVLRWDQEKYETVINTHTRDSAIVQELDRYLAAWMYAGKETGVHEGNYRVLFQDESERWYAFSFGPHSSSNSITAITIVGSRRRKFLRNRLQGMKDIVNRGEK